MNTLRIDLGHVEHIATMTRADFESGAVTDKEIIAAAIEFDYAHQLVSFVPNLDERNSLIQAGKLLKVNRQLVRHHW